MLEQKGFTGFEIDVYKAVCSIAWGRTRSYGQIARAIGRPNAQRAVGQALKKNPFPLVIPCHRVIKSDGSPGGFSGGGEFKKRLLDAEKIAII